MQIFFFAHSFTFGKKCAIHVQDVKSSTKKTESKNITIRTHKWTQNTTQRSIGRVAINSMKEW